MTGLSVVDAPSMYSIAKSFLYIGWIRPTNSDFNQLPFVNKQFKVVSSSLDKSFSANCCFETTALIRRTDEIVFIEIEFGAGAGWIPCEEG